MVFQTNADNIGFLLDYFEFSATAVLCFELIDTADASRKHALIEAWRTVLERALESLKEFFANEADPNATLLLYQVRFHDTSFMIESFTGSLLSGRCVDSTYAFILHTLIEGKNGVACAAGC